MSEEAATVGSTAPQSEPGASVPPAERPCRFFSRKGGCKKGAKCEWKHDPLLARVNAKRETPEGGPRNPPEGPARKPEKGGKKKSTGARPAKTLDSLYPLVELDVHLTETEFGELKENFPEFTLKNGPKHLTSPHAYDRAERACVSRTMPKSATRPVLEVQGRFRVTDAPTRDVCRHLYTTEDDEHVCDDDCAHEAQLRAGVYDTVVGIDVPAEPAFVRTLLDSPGVKQVLLALHLHTEKTSVLGSQTASWVPKNDEEDAFEEDGSVGKFRIQCRGRAGWEENDHAWITLQMPVQGVKPEIVGVRGTYTIVRCTRTRDAMIRPVAVPSMWDLLKKRSPPAYLTVETPGGGLELVRFSDELVCFSDGRGWVSASGDHLRHAHDLIASRPLTAMLRRKVVTALVRENGAVDGTRIAAFVMDAELHDQQQAEDAWDLPAPALARSRMPFGWLFQSFSRRSLAGTLAQRARGEYVRPSRFYKLWAALCALVAAVLPWPWRACTSLSELGFDNFEVGSVGAGNPGLSQLARIPWHALTVCEWVWSWGGYDIILRALIVIVVAMCMPRLAYACPAELREAYVNDRFSPVYYEGPLPECFGLPGYVCEKELKPLGDGCKISVKDPSLWVDVENPKDMLFAVGVVFGGHLPHVSLPCQQNLVAACRNRQLAPMPAANETVFTEVADQYFMQLRTVSDVSEEDFEAWNSRFPAGRQRNQRTALATWQERAITAFEVLLRNTFIKVEKVLRVEKGPFDPRVITGASDYFNVIWGSWFYTARDVLKEAYEDLPNNVLLASGSTSPELGAWFTRALESEGRAICGDDQLIITRGIFVESDGARHDAHMHKLFFEFKWRVYEFLFRLIPRRVLWVAKEAARHTVGRSRQYGVKLEHDYRVRSGDPDTEKGNSVCTDLVAWQTQNIVREMHDAGHTAAEMQREVPRRILDLGYEVEVKISRDPTDVTFLSGSFLPVNGTMYWHPLPGRQLCKIGWSLRDTKGVTPWRDFAGVLNSYRDFSFVPFLRVYVDVVSQLVPEAYRLEPPSKRWQVGPGITPQAPADDTWDWFTRRYSLTPGDEEEFRQQLLQVKSLPFMLMSDAIEHIIRVDMA